MNTEQNIHMEGKEIPSEIASKFKVVIDEISEIEEKLDKICKTVLPGKSYSFEYTHSAPKPLLSEYERAQAVCFLAKYQLLPDKFEVVIEKKDGKYHLSNLDYFIHALNEYRPILMNEGDSSFYNNIQTHCHLILSNKNPGNGLSVTVKNKKNEDITEAVTKLLGENTKCIRSILKECEYDYIYNGFLQHSDHKYTSRLLEEYHSGKLNYVFVKHALLLARIKELLIHHARIMAGLTHPQLGPL